MKRIAKFEKVSFKEFSPYGDKAVYDDIRLPERATSGSAGYDFFAPTDLTVLPNRTVTVATGIRCKIDDGWALFIYPRSSLGFKYRLTLNNTVGVIDGDYYGADNEGHIFIKMTVCGDKSVTLKKGAAFAQGVFTEYGITEDDDAKNSRTGGLGSTDKK